MPDGGQAHAFWVANSRRTLGAALNSVPKPIPVRYSQSSFPRVLLCCLLVLAASCQERPPTQPSSAGGAGKRLADFGRSNPGCRLWTDWQSMCSRSGPGGALRCSSDPGRPVEPSEPFCVAARGSEAVPYVANFQALRESSLRFCAARIEDAGEAERTGEPELCEAYSPDRPFNGRRVAAIRHPWCEAWSDSVDGRAICAEAPGGKSSASSCASLADANYEHENPLLCTEWRSDVPCERPFGGAGRRGGAGVVVGGAPGPDSRAVSGTFCLD